MCHSVATQQRKYAVGNTATAFTLAVVAERFQEVLQEDQAYTVEIRQRGDNKGVASSRLPRDSESESEQGDDKKEYAGGEESDEEGEKKRKGKI